ncbi:hypothetical protein JW935_23345 [candidate division KSB1 bacterium]|nr:hypothetical protein [candidate division KSB1 bacterium]
MKNPYKRTDVFVCNYETHTKFENKVSVFHVMYSRKCYPQGCFFYKWSCDLKNKGKTCIRRFKHVGRLCEGCMHWAEERMHYQPKIKLSALEFERFLSELDDFEDWISTFVNREPVFWGEVDSIKPRFRRYQYMAGHQLHLDGYLLVFKHGYIGTTELDDLFYAFISPRQQERLCFSAGDRFEARGKFILDRGRIVFEKIWAVEFESRSGGPVWHNSEALVARETATFFETQPEVCLHCPQGALVDVYFKENGTNKVKRRLYCLEGVKDPYLCYVSGMQKINHCYEIKK